MNLDYEKQLEASVRRALEGLEELPAPPALASRIMQRIAEQPAAPWYRRAWPTWPVGLRLASLAILIGGFGGLCFGTWELVRTVSALETTSNWFADAQALWRTTGVLVDLVHTYTGRLGTGVIVTGLVLLFGVTATCIGLGSACVRLALRPAYHSLSNENIQ